MLTKLKTTVFFILLLTTSSFAQTTLTSPYLQTPSLTIGYVDSCATFWESTWDSTGGGFFKDINRSGAHYNDWKSMLSQSRHAYGFVRAYQMTSKQEYLDTARVALQWMIDHAWDFTNGGWFWDIDPDGNIYDTNANKTAFYQHYALLGIAAYVEATRDSAMTDWLVRGYETLEDQFWDSRPGYEGYYDVIDANGSNPRNKSFNATVDAVTTHLLLLQLMGVDSLAGHSISDRLNEMGREMVDRLVGTMDDYAIGFVESFDSNWGWNDDPSDYNTRTLMGHVLKTGWCLARIEQVLPDTAWIPAAEKAVTDVWENGYDDTYGGPYKDYDRVSGDEFTYGQAPGVKAWWQMEQAITAGLQLYYQTYDPRWLEMADESLDFFMDYFVDRTYGEIYADRTRTGNEVPGWGSDKGNGGKAGYHSIETGYYTYLYGSLLLTGDPVVLRYKIESADSDRVLTMMPIAMDSASLKLDAVTLDNVAYTQFDRDAHTLQIPEGTGGTFALTFLGTSPALGVETQRVALLPTRPILNAPWPNPFNATARVSFELSRAQYVQLTVFDLLGREVRTLENGQMAAGRHQVVFEAEALPSGVYLLHLSTPSGSSTQRMVLVK